jgi:hypothetical protein
MEIQTRHRKSAEANRPKGRALFALAERREAPIAALLAALTVGMAAWVKSAFGGNALSVEAAATPAPDLADAAMSRIAPAEKPLEAASALAPPVPDEAAPDAQALEEAVADLGRIGRGPAAPDLSRFFQLEEPTIDLPPQATNPAYGGNGGITRPSIDRPDVTAPAGAVAAGKEGGPAVPDGGQAGGSDGGAPPPDAGEFDGIRFETLFARLAEVVRPFHPQTVRDIGSVTIGDWISAHELQRLRGNDSRPDAEAAFMARENQTYQVLSNEDTREAFLERHFPSAGEDAVPSFAAADGVPEHAAMADTPAGLL